VAAEVPADAERRRAGEPQEPAAPRRPAAARDERRAVEGEGGDVRRGVHDPHPTDLVVGGLGVRPVQEPRGGGGQRGGDPDADEPPRGAVGVAPADRVEQAGARPRADRQVGQERVQGVPQRAPAERVAHRAGLHGIAHRAAEARRHRVESCEAADPLDRRVQDGRGRRLGPAGQAWPGALRRVRFHGAPFDEAGKPLSYPRSARRPTPLVQRHATLAGRHPRRRARRRRHRGRERRRPRSAGELRVAP
jgi:hypothetical protein